MSDLGKYPLPKGWTWATIPDLVGETGVFVDGDWVESIDQDPSGNVRLIQLADVGDGVYRDKSERFMTKAKAEELRCTFLNEGDVLIARMPDPLGRELIERDVVAEAAAVCRIGRATAYEYVRDGILPGLRMGRRIVVPRMSAGIRSGVACTR